MTRQGKWDDGQGETFEAPWAWAPPRGGLSACAQHQLEWITPVIVSNSSGKGKAGWKAMQRDGRKEPAHFFFRNGRGRETGKVYNTYPGTLALEGNCLCRSSVVSLMGFRFKAKGINLAGSSAQESYSQKETWNIILFHQKLNFFPNSYGLFHWPYQTQTPSILRAGPGREIVLF